MKKQDTIACVITTAVLALWLTGCASRVPLTKALLKEYNLTSSDIRKLQLYVSDGILLEKEVMSVDKDVDETHSLKKVEDRYIKQIHFKAGTPCIAASTASDVLSVAFEPQDQLIFAIDPSHPRGNVYSYKPDRSTAPADSLLQRPGFSSWSAVGTETYVDSTFTVFVRRNMPYLLVDEASLKNLVIESRKVPGMRPGDLPAE